MGSPHAWLGMQKPHTQTHVKFANQDFRQYQSISGQTAAQNESGFFEHTRKRSGKIRQNGGKAIPLAAFYPKRLKDFD